jgi:hypothetical protein
MTIVAAVEIAAIAAGAATSADRAETPPRLRVALMMATAAITAETARFAIIHQRVLAPSTTARAITVVENETATGTVAEISVEIGVVIVTRTKIKTKTETKIKTKTETKIKTKTETKIKIAAVIAAVIAAGTEIAIRIAGAIEAKTAIATRIGIANAIAIEITMAAIPGTITATTTAAPSMT